MSISSKLTHQSSHLASTQTVCSRLIKGDRILLRGQSLDERFVLLSRFKEGNPTLLTLDPAGGNTIDSPGYYLLTESVDMPLIGAGSAVDLLTITSDNVCLDLNGKILNGNGDKTTAFANDSTQAYSNGIRLAAGLKKVCIFNGCLTNFSGAGIVGSPDFTDVKVHDLVFEGCGDRQLNYYDSGAIVFTDQTFGAPAGDTLLIERVSTRNTWGSAIILVHYGGLSNVIIQHCSIVDFYGAQYTGFAEIINFDTQDRIDYGANAQGIYTEGTIINPIIRYVDLKGGIGEFNVVPVLHFSTLQNAIISDVNVSNCTQNATSNEIDTGVYYSFIQLQGIAYSNQGGTSANVQISRCNVSNLTCNFNVSIPSAEYSALSYSSMAGFYIQGASSCHMEGCTITEMNSTGVVQPISYAKSHSGSNSTPTTWSLVDCHADTITSSGVPAFGFYREQNSTGHTESITLDRCTVRKLTSGTGYTPGDTLTAFPAAFSWISPTSAPGTDEIKNVVMRDCVVEHVRNARCVYVGSAVNRATIQRCVFNDCDSNGIEINGTSGVVEDCVLQGCDVGILVLDGTVDWTVNDNTLLNCTSSGIRQETAGDLNSYMRNRVQNCGTNYDTTPANTPIRTWTLGSAPGAAVSGADLDNQSIS